MLDSDLAELYKVSTKRLNEQVKRNKLRFPAEFMFQLTNLEVSHLRSQIVTTNLQWTKNITKQLDLDLKKYNSQYTKINIKKINKIHDRFIIIDKQEIYHFGASLKDLGKKLFAFSKLNKELITIILNKLK